jgi:NRPS condensation-like uncharacterized protein
MKGTYILRDIDDEFWRKVKSKAAAEGMTVKDVILKLLAEWVKGRKYTARAVRSQLPG